MIYMIMNIVYLKPLKPIWLKSHLSLNSHYWYVVACDICGKSITGHMRLTNGDGETMKVLLNWFACHDQFDLAKKGHNHIIIYSWHRVTHMWSITGFLQIFHAATYQQMGPKICSDLPCSDISVNWTKFCSDLPCSNISINGTKICLDLPCSDISVNGTKNLLRSSMP